MSMSEVVAPAAADVGTATTRPKSKKELRAEKKAAKKAADAAAATSQTPAKPLSPAEIKEQEHRLKKERRKEHLKEREKETRREAWREKKERKQTRKRRELHAVGGGLDPRVAAKRLEERQSKKRRKRNQADESKPEGQDLDVFDKVFNGSGGEDDSGARTLERGVKCLDVVIGKGPNIVQNNSLVSVMYKLKGGKLGALIDSSNKFTFRVGKGEVIQGWDIGVQGMAVGGTRKLIVPPKAGYGPKDIGAGPGALLYFNITVLSCN